MKAPEASADVHGMVEPERADDEVPIDRARRAARRRPLTTVGVCWWMSFLVLVSVVTGLPAGFVLGLMLPTALMWWTVRGDPHLRELETAARRRLPVYVIDEYFPHGERSSRLADQAFVAMVETAKRTAEEQGPPRLRLAAPWRRVADVLPRTWLVVALVLSATSAAVMAALAAPLGGRLLIHPLFTLIAVPTTLMWWIAVGSSPVRHRARRWRMPMVSVGSLVTSVLWAMWAPGIPGLMLWPVIVLWLAVVFGATCLEARRRRLASAVSLAFLAAAVMAISFELDTLNHAGLEARARLADVRISTADDVSDLGDADHITCRGDQVGRVGWITHQGIPAKSWGLVFEPEQGVGSCRPQSAVDSTTLTDCEPVIDGWEFCRFR